MKTVFVLITLLSIASTSLVAAQPAAAQPSTALPPPPPANQVVGPLAEPDPYLRVRELDGVDLTGKVVGGEDTTITANPWQVALLRPGIANQLSAQFCGGSYIGGGWILTAAHCFRSVTGPADVLVVVGATRMDGSQAAIPVTEIVRHSGFNTTTLDNDIAVIRVAESQLNGRAQVISIAQGAQPGPAVDIQTTGWGRVADRGTKSLVLKSVTVPHQPRSICNALDAYNGQVTPNMFCAGLPAGGKDSCAGDSGGPATAIVGGTRQLVGIVSWGVSCALPKRYGVYTRLSNYTTWVAQNTPR